MIDPSLPSLLVSHWHPTGVPDLAAAAAAALYLGGMARFHTRWPPRRTAAFLCGLACIVVATDSGIGAYDDQLLSVHMVQHMLLLVVAPLLLLAGRPVILALRALPARRRRALAAVLYRLASVTRRAVCLVTFSAVLVVTHLPAFYDATLRHPAVHNAEHALYLIAGLLLWWPLLDADPVPAHRLTGLGRLVYLLATMPPMAIVGAYLNRHPTLLYPPYGPPARAMGISAVVDQQQAGAIMWVAGSAIVIAVGLWVTIAALVAEERRQQAREAHAIGGSVP
ncbi:MAG TPA: cytochrome c oxidase assembly protein [Solirubrobacteraceae bacterium]|nr:cytochrome c oxidase assembly protein [Solirubrobacteraceae bacterium]